MTGKRTYDDACGTAHALELIGERWALLVVRELMLGPRRFTDLRAGLPGISPNVLTQRLNELEQASIVVRRRLPPPAASRVYELTEWGRELEPVIQAVGRWAARSPTRPGDRPLSVASLVLSFGAMFDPHAAQDLTANIELRLDDQRFRLSVADGRLSVEPGATEAPDAVITAGPNALAAVVYGGRKLSKALRAGELTIEGDRPLVKRVLKLFPLPEPAPATAPHE